MQAPVLNVDVLYSIMAYSNRKTLLSMMLTCRNLHRGGIKHLLRTDPELSSKEQVDSFISFCTAGGLVAEVAYRVNYLRGLKLGYGFRHGDKNTAKALTKFFTTAVRVYGHNFARLRISGADDLFAADPNLSEAIASITTLTHLDISDVDHGSFPFLAALKSRLVEAVIGMNLELGDPPDKDITDLLRHSESSMTAMALTYTINPTGVACYPNVRTLTVSNLDIPITRDYVSTFPNLQVLRATECLGRFSEDHEEYLEHRNINIAQRGRGGTWTSLRAYEGSILFLYLLGLGCHVTYVYLDVSYDGESMDFKQVRAVVTDTSPEHLEIYVDEMVHVLDQAEDIIALFGSPESHAVKTFELGLSLDDDDVDMEAMLECIHSAVSSSSLTGFALTVSRSGEMEFLESSDVSAVADRLLGSCESLRTVKIVFGERSVERGPAHVFFDKKTLPEKYPWPYIPS